MPFTGTSTYSPPVLVTVMFAPKHCSRRSSPHATAGVGEPIFYFYKDSSRTASINEGHSTPRVDHDVVRSAPRSQALSHVLAPRAYPAIAPLSLSAQTNEHNRNTTGTWAHVAGTLREHHPGNTRDAGRVCKRYSKRRGAHDAVQSAPCPRALSVRTPRDQRPLQRRFTVQQCGAPQTRATLA